MNELFLCLEAEVKGSSWVGEGGTGDMVTDAGGPWADSGQEAGMESISPFLLLTLFRGFPFFVLISPLKVQGHVVTLTHRIWSC